MNLAQPLKHLFLIDGSGFIFRAFHALPPMIRSDGTPTNAVYGFTTMLMKLVEDTEADHIAVVFDTSRKSFRTDLYPDYKAHRPPPPPELVPQFALVREAAQALNVAAVEQDGLEADDLIASYALAARAQGARVTIVSSDKDLMQLVGDGIEMQDPMKNKIIGPDQVMEKFGVPPDKVVEVMALIGDSSDNVPGVPGIGPKTAAELIQTYGDLDGVLAAAQSIKQPKRRQALQEHAEAARLSRRLVQLKSDAALPRPLDDFARRPPDPGPLGDFLGKMEFRSLKAKHGAPASSAPGPARYEMVQDEAALKAWIAKAEKAGIVAVDTETTGLDALTCDLVGISLAVAPGEACYIPLGHVDPGIQGDLLGGAKPAPEQIPRDRALALLGPLLADGSVLKVGQNIKFDLLVLGQQGLAVDPIDDSMVVSYVLDSVRHGHGMDELAKRHLNHDTIKYEDVCGSGKSQITFERVALDRALAYAAEDADITLRLYQLLKPRLREQGLLAVHETLERPLIPVLALMEKNGIMVDAAHLKALSVDFAKRMAELEEAIHRLAGRPFNVASPKQLGEVLFEEMSLKGGKKSAKTGAWGTGADVLESLAAEGHDLPARVLDWRQLAKLKSTYADALVERINPKTGRVHTRFAQTVTSTGRLASSDPNLQNIPIRSEEGRKIRQAFIAPPGWLLLSADYSQIELRLVAHVADIAALKQAFHEGADIHAITAAQVFGVPIEGMDPMVRRQAKAINFGIIYGMGAFGLASQLGIPVGEASRFIEAYFARYPEIRAYMERTKEEAKRQGYVTTLFGRRCAVMGLDDKNPGGKGMAERAAINAPIQGGAADIIKRAMIRLPGALKKAGLQAKLLLQVHDELVLEVPEAQAQETAGLVKSVMEGAAELSVPLIVETGLGPNWAQAH